MRASDTLFTRQQLLAESLRVVRGIARNREIDCDLLGSTKGQLIEFILADQDEFFLSIDRRIADNNTTRVSSTSQVYALREEDYHVEPRPPAHDFPVMRFTRDPMGNHIVTVPQLGTPGNPYYTQTRLQAMITDELHEVARMRGIQVTGRRNAAIIRDIVRQQNEYIAGRTFPPLPYTQNIVDVPRSTGFSDDDTFDDDEALIDYSAKAEGDEYERYAKVFTPKELMQLDKKTMIRIIKSRAADIPDRVKRTPENLGFYILADQVNTDLDDEHIIYDKFDLKEMDVQRLVEILVQDWQWLMPDEGVFGGDKSRLCDIILERQREYLNWPYVPAKAPVKKTRWGHIAKRVKQ